MDIYYFLVLTHLIGTILGVGGATMIEVHLNKALQSKEMSGDERAILGTDYAIVRIGLILGLLSGFGFLIFYKMTGNTFKLYDPTLWAKMLIIIIIAVNAVLLQARKISLYWGAALSFTSWWVAAILGTFMTNSIKFDFFGSYTFVTYFLSIMIVYAVAVAVGAVALDFIRKRLGITS